MKPTKLMSLLNQGWQYSLDKFHPVNRYPWDDGKKTPMGDEQFVLVFIRIIHETQTEPSITIKVLQKSALDKFLNKYKLVEYIDIDNIHNYKHLIFEER